MHDGYGYSFDDALCEHCKAGKADPKESYRVKGYFNKDELLLCSQCTIESLIWANHMKRDIRYKEKEKIINMQRRRVAKIYIDFDNLKLLIKTDESDD